MKNKFRIIKNKIFISVQLKGELYDCLIDKKDFALVNSFNGTWYLRSNGIRNRNQKPIYYVAINRRLNGKNNPITLHRLLMNFPKGKTVDHKDRNPLNNTRRNLRIVSHMQNCQNRGPDHNSLTGVRGIYFDVFNKKFSARIWFCKKFYWVGRFQTLSEASIAVSVLRKKLEQQNETA